MESHNLESLGLSKNESKIYLALLRIGKSSVSQIAKESKVHRTNIYEALQRLIQKNLVQYITESKIKLFVASPPVALQNMLEDQQTILENMMPKLELLAQQSKTKEQASIFHGLKGLQTIFENIIAESANCVAFGIPKQAPLVMTFIDNFHRKRVFKKLNMRTIYDENAKERIKELNAMPHTHAKYYPHKKISIVGFIIYNNKVAMWTWRRPMFVILIESEEMARSFNEHFELLWDMCEEVQD